MVSNYLPKIIIWYFDDREDSGGSYSKDGKLRDGRLYILFDGDRVDLRFNEGKSH